MLYTNNKIKNPKLTVNKVIKKFLIINDLKIDGDTPVYYKWDKRRQPVWYREGTNIYPRRPYFTIDYNKKKREWYVGYIRSIDFRKFTKINDITSNYDILDEP